MRLLDLGIAVLPSSQPKLVAFWTWLKVAVMGVAAFAFEPASGPFALFRLYMLFILWDFATGVVASLLQRKVNSAVAWKGILKKCMGVAAVGFAHAIDLFLGTAKPDGFPGPCRGAVVRMLIGMEFFSIGENLAAAGIVLPKSVTDLWTRVTSPATVPGTTVHVDTVKETTTTMATVATVIPAHLEHGEKGETGATGPQGPAGPAGGST